MSENEEITMAIKRLGAETNPEPKSFNFTGLPLDVAAMIFDVVKNKAAGSVEDLHALENLSATYSLAQSLSNIKERRKTALDIYNAVVPEGGLKKLSDGITVSDVIETAGPVLNDISPRKKAAFIQDIESIQDTEARLSAIKDLSKYANSFSKDRLSGLMSQSINAFLTYTTVDKNFRHGRDALTNFYDLLSNEHRSMLRMGLEALPDGNDRGLIISRSLKRKSISEEISKHGKVAHLDKLGPEVAEALKATQPESYERMDQLRGITSKLTVSTPLSNSMDRQRSGFTR